MSGTTLNWIQMKKSVPVVTELLVHLVRVNKNLASKGDSEFHALPSFYITI